jgi:hypothetical protein
MKGLNAYAGGISQDLTQWWGKGALAQEGSMLRLGVVIEFKAAPLLGVSFPLAQEGSMLRFGVVIEFKAAPLLGVPFLRQRGPAGTGPKAGARMCECFKAKRMVVLVPAFGDHSSKNLNSFKSPVPPA